MLGPPNVLGEDQNASWRLWSGSGFLRNQARSQGEPDQTWNIIDVEVLHQLHTVVFHRLGTDLEGQSDGLGGLALGNELEDLALPRSQPLDRAAGMGDSLQGEVFAQLLRDLRAQIDFPADDALQGRLQFRDRRLLEQVA